MHGMQLRAIDLNLLVVLDAILETNSVKGAADRLALTPSATSHALSRLRDVLEDPILVRAGRRMVPSPRVERIRTELRALLEGVERVLEAGREFDPASLNRTFRIVGTDYVELELVPELSRRLARDAPGVSLEMRRAHIDQVAQLRSGECDVLIGVQSSAPEDIHIEEILVDEFVCLLRRDHPVLAGRLTLRRYAALEHVLVAPRGASGSLLDRVLAEHGLSRRVARTVSTFAAAPHLVADSDYVVTLPGRIAERAAASLGLAIRRPPLRIPRMSLRQAWHARHDADPAHHWLRERIREATA